MLLAVVVIFSAITYLSPYLSVFRHTWTNISTIEWIGLLVLNCIVKPISTALMYFSLPITVLSNILYRKKYQRTTAENIASAIIFALSFVTIILASPYIYYNVYILVFALITGYLYANIFKNTNSFLYVAKANLIVNIVPILMAVVIEIM